MGVLNVTPDSFSDGGRYATVDAAVARAEQMISEGAFIIDVGGESTRPGAEDVDANVEIERVVPVIERIASSGRLVSVDTRKAVVAKAAIDAGATIVNDVSAGAYDPAMLPLIADRGVPVVLMHMRGTPQTMDQHAVYDDVARDVIGELNERVAAARDAGIEAGNVLIDPGLGFAKTPQQSLELLRRIGEIAALGFPLIVGPSRKRFVGHVLGAEVDDRLEGSIAASLWCAMHGVAIVRVHDVLAVRRALDMWRAIRDA
jgi:dihydropteroate synthase